jgi:hypothetical protein
MFAPPTEHTFAEHMFGRTAYYTRGNRRKSKSESKKSHFIKPRQKKPLGERKFAEGVGF